MLPLLAELKLESTITIGNILTLIVVLLTLTIWWVRTETRVRVIEKWIETHEKDSEKRDKSIRQLELIAERLKTLNEVAEKRLQRLEDIDSNPRRLPNH